MSALEQNAGKVGKGETSTPLPLFMHHVTAQPNQMPTNAVLFLTIQGKDIRGIPSEKIGQNIHPLESLFLSLIINIGLVQVHFGQFWPPWTIWGAQGGFWGRADLKNDIIARGPF